MEGIENKGEITKRQEAPMVLYQLEGENISVSMMYFNETFWMPQKAMSELFDVGVPAINKHLKNIFADEELEESMVVSKMEITTPHGAIEGKTIRISYFQSFRVFRGFQRSLKNIGH